jgi:hypothetical protein
MLATLYDSEDVGLWAQRTFDHRKSNVPQVTGPGKVGPVVYQDETPSAVAAAIPDGPRDAGGALQPIGN